MTKPNSTEIVVIMDRSGSMALIKNDMEGGFNTFIEEQRKLPGDCTVTLIQFDDKYEVVYTNKPLSDVPKMTLSPRGSTALLGAIGFAIDSVGERLSNTSEENRPDRVLFVIITDGEENASFVSEWSKQYTKKEVLDRVGHQSQKYNWQFVYLGANQDAIAKGGELGINTAFNFTASAAGTEEMLRSVTIGTSNYRSNGSYSVS